MLADLLIVNLDGPNAAPIRVIPKTGALLEQKLRSLDPVTSWWFERLMDGAPTHRHSTWPKRLQTSVLFDDYVRTAERVGVRRKADATALGMRLKKLVPTIQKIRISATVEMPDGSRVHRRAWAVELPSLRECRQSFVASLQGQQVDWPPDEDGGGNGDAREAHEWDEFDP